MTATITEDITHLDFEEAIPCEADYHPHHGPDLPAEWTIRTHCPECHESGTFLVCDHWLRMVRFAAIIDCSRCGCESEDYRDFIIEIRSIK